LTKQVESDKDNSSYENLLNKIKRSFLSLSLILFQCLNSHVPLLKIGINVINWRGRRSSYLTSLRWLLLYWKSYLPLHTSPIEARFLSQRSLYQRDDPEQEVFEASLLSSKAASFPIAKNPLPRLILPLAQLASSTRVLARFTSIDL